MPRLMKVCPTRSGTDRYPNLLIPETAGHSWSRYCFFSDLVSAPYLLAFTFRLYNRNASPLPIWAMSGMMIRKGSAIGQLW